MGLVQQVFNYDYHNIFNSQRQNIQRQFQKTYFEFSWFKRCSNFRVSEQQSIFVG